MRTLKKELSEGKLRRLYLLYGAEDFLVSRYAREIESRCLECDDGIRQMNLTEFSDGGARADDIIEVCETMPFMYDRRVVISWRRGFFAFSKKDESEVLAAYFERIPETATLIFIEDEADKRGRIYKSAAKFGLICEFPRQDEAALVSWLRGLADSKGARLDRETALLLLRVSGGDMSLLYNELTKLADHSGRNPITAEDVKALCVKSPEARIFEMVEAISRSDAEKALSGYDELIQTKQQPIMILGMIARQYRLMCRCRFMSERGASLQDIAKELGVMGFVVRGCLRDGANFSEKSLLCGLSACLDTDKSIKTGTMGDKLAVEMLVARLCSAR